MNYGLYLSAAGALTNVYRQGLVANNLANVSTIGFKPDVAYSRQRLPERLESTSTVDAKHMLERLGGGQFLEPTRITLKQGSLIDTGNDLDLAIEGEGFFVLAPDAAAGEQDLRLTRDGRLALNEASELVAAGTGMRLLDVNNRIIRLDSSAPVTIHDNGRIVQDGAEIARLQITSPADQRDLRKVGENLLRIDRSGPGARRAATGAVRQQHLESSAVDPINALNQLISVSKAVQGNIKMMQYHDHIIGQAVNTLGRVS